MAQAGEHSRSSSDAAGRMPSRVYTVEYWLNSKFQQGQHPLPLAGFIPLEGLTNLEVLARLVSLNGGCAVEGWGSVGYDENAPYKFRGLANAQEGLLLATMMNFAAGMAAALGESAERTVEIIEAQIALDTGKVVKH